LVKTADVKLTKTSTSFGSLWGGSSGSIFEQSEKVILIAVANCAVQISLPMCERFPTIKMIAFNGGTAGRVGVKVLGPQAAAYQILTLPSRVGLGICLDYYPWKRDEHSRPNSG
jgi:hypothetical protein